MTSAPALYPTLPRNSAANKLNSIVEINVKCSNLKNLDVFSKSDPMVVLFQEEKLNNEKQWKQIGRTEVIMNNLNPEFTTPFKMNYNFEQYQKLKFEVYDVDSKSSSLSAHDFLGNLEISLGSLVGENCGYIKANLLDQSKKKLNSMIEINAEQMNDNKENLKFLFRGINLDKKDFFGKSDPFLILYRHGIENKNYSSIYQTEVIKNTLNPTWKSFQLSLQSICNGDKLRPIKVECYDWDSDGSNDFIGQFEMTINDIINNKRKFELINEGKKKKKRGYKNSGIIEIANFQLEERYDFLDYIMGNVELCFHVAVDFTASNGNPSIPQSLHYRNGNQPNQYMLALQSVGRICEDYDSDKLMPAYGFGARINGVTYHSFHLNQTPNPTCFGIAGVLDAYFRSIQTVELYGPTNFSPVINLVANEASRQTAKYHVLLIVTDGIISDMGSTKQAIISASSLPMSIIIVGVGGADFDAMDELDSDNGALNFNGVKSERDIVQFVPFGKFSGAFAGDLLAKEVLYEVPHQLVSYMTKRGIKPAPRINQPPPQQDYLQPSHIDPNIPNTESAPYPI